MIALQINGHGLKVIVPWDSIAYMAYKAFLLQTINRATDIMQLAGRITLEVYGCLEAVVLPLLPVVI